MAQDWGDEGPLKIVAVQAEVGISEPLTRVPFPWVWVYRPRSSGLFTVGGNLLEARVLLFSFFDLRAPVC